MKRACVIGWPVAHSRSPLIHGHWLARYGIEGTYERAAVPPEEIGAFLRDLRAGGFVGANVTVPHKEVALAAAAHVDDVAHGIGAANTLWLENGVLNATNTDAYGFLRNLDDLAPGWAVPGGVAVVLGAGGAARSVLRGLLDRGVAEIRLVNRTKARADELARFFGRPVHALEWINRGQALNNATLLVNTTTLGMKGEPALDIDLDALPASAVVSDLIYVPLETPLLRQARQRGLRTVDGLGMLLHQAVPGFEKWFGVRPEVTAELRDIILRDIAGSV